MKPYQQLLVHLRAELRSEMFEDFGSAENEIYRYAYHVRAVAGDTGVMLELPEHCVEGLLISARTSRGAFDLAVEIAVSQLFANAPLHPKLGTFAGLVLSKNYPEPRKTTNPSGDRLWARDWHFINAMTVLPDKFGLPATRNESHGEHGISIADGIAEVVSDLTRTVVTYESVKKVWDNRKKRIRYELLNHYYINGTNSVGSD